MVVVIIISFTLLVSCLNNNTSMTDEPEASGIDIIEPQHHEFYSDLVLNGLETPVNTFSDESYYDETNNSQTNENESGLNFTIGITNISGTYQNSYDGRGNFFNGSFVSFDGEWYYFFHPSGNSSTLVNDSFYLYRVNRAFDTVQKISDNVFLGIARHQDMIIAINNNGHLIRIYGGNQMETIIDDFVNNFIVRGNYVYYLGSNFDLSRIRIDGTGQELLLSNVISFYVYGDSIFYADGNGIHMLSNGISRRIAGDEKVEGIIVDGNYMYYLTYEAGFPNDYAGSFYSTFWIVNELVRLDMESGNKVVLAENVIRYNKSNDIIFYTRNGGEGLYSLDLNTNEIRLVSDKIFWNFNICGDRIFFAPSIWASGGIEPVIYTFHLDGSDFREIKYMQNSGASRYQTFREFNTTLYNVTVPLGWTTGGSNFGTNLRVDSLQFELYDGVINLYIGFVICEFSVIYLSIPRDGNVLVKPEDNSLEFTTEQGLAGLYVIRTEEIDGVEHTILIFNYKTSHKIYLLRANAPSVIFNEYKDTLFDILSSFVVL